MLHWSLLSLSLQSSPSARLHARPSNSTSVHLTHNLSAGRCRVPHCSGAVQGTPICTNTPTHQHNGEEGQEFLDIVREFSQWGKDCSIPQLVRKLAAVQRHMVETTQQTGGCQPQRVVPADMYLQLILKLNGYKWYEREWNKLTARPEWDDAAQLLLDAAAAIFQRSPSFLPGSTYQSTHTTVTRPEQGSRRAVPQHVAMPDTYLTILEYLPIVLLPSVGCSDHVHGSSWGSCSCTSSATAQTQQRQLTAAVTQFWQTSGLLDGTCEWQDEESEPSTWSFSALKAYLTLLQVAGVWTGQAISNEDNSSVGAVGHVVDLMCDRLSDSLTDTSSYAYDGICLNDWAGLVELLANTDYRSEAVNRLMNIIVPEITVRAVLKKSQRT